MTKVYYKIRQKSSFFIVILTVWSLVLGGSVYAKIPNDPQYLSQNPAFEKIGVQKAWDYTTGSKEVVVAVIDTGADILHQDLKDNIWKNPSEIVGNGIDDDRNGFVDDVNGWNFADNNNDVGISIISKDDDPEAVTHGTILAGLIGGVGNNNLDGTGLNWNVQIMPIRAIKSNGSGTLSDVAKGVEYAANNGAHVISLSFVGEMSDPALDKSLRDAYRKGVVIVAAAGNSVVEGQDDLTKVKRYPVCGDEKSSENWIIGVTSVDLQDRLSDFADFGSCVDLVAPGENIFSTQRYAPEFGYVKTFAGGWYGTSFSVPLVAGAAALIKSVRPDWEAKEIIADLLSTADDIDRSNPLFVGRMGYGRLNVYKAVAKAVASTDVTKIVEKKNTKKNTSKFIKYDSSGNQIASVETKTPSKWVAYKGDLIFARLTKGSLSLESQNWDGTNTRLWTVKGINALNGLEVGRFWRSGDQVLMKALQNKKSVQFTFDLSSQSWRRE